MRGMLLLRHPGQITVLGAMSLCAVVLAQPEPVFEIRTAGISSIEPHPKDAAAYAALELFGDRLIDLGDELELEPDKRTGISLLWEMAMRGMAMRIDLTEDGPGMAMALTPGTALDWVKLANFEGADVEEDERGALVFPTPIGPARMSVVQGTGETFTRLKIGNGGEIEPGVERGELPGGATPVISGRLDLEGLGAFLLPKIAQDDEAGARFIEQSGWLGEGAPKLEFSVGVTETLMLGHFRAVNARRAYESVGGSTGTFGVEDFRVVPMDATIVSGSNMSLEKIVALIDLAAGEKGEDPLGQASETLGIDFRQDVLLNLGPRLIYYQSETTGGGGLLSAVLLAEIRDAAAFEVAQNQIVEHLNHAAATEANGYVRVRRWSVGESEAMSLTFPGLPIPVEPSWCVRGDRLIIAASPTGLIAAVSQFENSERSVLDLSEFASTVVESWPSGGATAMTFTDAARLSQKGYGLTNLLTSALANVARSPASPDRVQGPLMPSYSEFTAGIQPYMEMGWWEGDDLVYISRSDRSMLVQLATGLGMMTEMQGLALPVLLGAMNSEKQGETVGHEDQEYDPEP